MFNKNRVKRNLLNSLAAFLNKWFGVPAGCPKHDINMALLRYHLLFLGRNEKTAYPARAFSNYVRMYHSTWIKYWICMRQPWWCRTKQDDCRWTKWLGFKKSRSNQGDIFVDRFWAFW